MHYCHRCGLHYSDVSLLFLNIFALLAVFNVFQSFIKLSIKLCNLQHSAVRGLLTLLIRCVKGIYIRKADINCY